MTSKSTKSWPKHESWKLNLKHVNSKVKKGFPYRNRRKGRENETDRQKCSCKPKHALTSCGCGYGAMHTLSGQLLPLTASLWNSSSVRKGIKGLRARRKVLVTKYSIWRTAFWWSVFSDWNTILLHSCITKRNDSVIRIIQNVYIFNFTGYASQNSGNKAKDLSNVNCLPPPKFFQVVTPATICNLLVLSSSHGKFGLFSLGKASCDRVMVPNLRCMLSVLLCP